MAEWQQGTFGCCGDMKTCLMGGLCTPCQVYQNAGNLGKSGVLYGLLSCWIPCLPIMLLRGEAREQYGIEGSAMDDALMSWCCTPCVSCQTAVECKAKGDA